MARKPALSTDKLKDLGADKLAQLVLEESERNAGFRRQVKAALAGESGPVRGPGKVRTYVTCLHRILLENLGGVKINAI